MSNVFAILSPEQDSDYKACFLNMQAVLYEQFLSELLLIVLT